MAVCLAAALILAAGEPKEPKASQLYDEGRRAERAGDVVRAYLLYSQAAALDPTDQRYWIRSQALRTQAALKAKAMPKPDQPQGEETSPAEAAEAGIGDTISDRELIELRRLARPPTLKATPGKKTLTLRGDARAVIERTAREFGIETVFDGDFQAGRPVRLHLDDVDYRQALRAVESATGTFVFPLGERLIMAVKDTPQKRTENEPTMAVTIDIPETVTIQEAQELARAVQQTMDIMRLAVDANRRMVLIKDRVSKVRPAQALFEQLAHTRAQFLIDMQFLEVDRTNMFTYGLLLPSQFPILYVGNGLTGAAANLARFFMGNSIFGLGIADAQLFATMNKSYSKTLLDAQVRSLDGSAATFHVGNKYPILAGGFLGQDAALGVVPSFNFEDLGVVLKVTPHANGMDEVSLDVEAEFKVLSGQSLNGIPVISSRKLESKVRVRNSEWAVIGGLMSTTEAKTLTGMAGLMNIPVLGTALRKNDNTRDSTEVLVLMKPTLLNPPPDQFMTRQLYVGSEARLEIPL
ncbi:MAG: type II secretion system protein GspD [Acidobacteriota bacterium]